MDFPKIDWPSVIATAERALAVAEASKSLIGLIPGVDDAMVQKAIDIARALVNGLNAARDDADLASDVLSADTQAALDALQPRLDALDADIERRLDET